MQPWRIHAAGTFKIVPASFLFLQEGMELWRKSPPLGHLCLNEPVKTVPEGPGFPPKPRKKK